MAKDDFYQLLGVARNVGGDELKKAYRKLAMQYHPDRNPGDKIAEEKFKKISEAYDILSDDQKRAAYDQYGHAAFEGGGSRGGPHGGPGAGFDFGDVFAQFFGGGGPSDGRNQSPNRGADQRVNLDVTLEEAFYGKKVELRINGVTGCEPCRGSGAAEGSKVVNCQTCKGQGRVRVSQGFFTLERTCPACEGQGKTIERPCGSCGGQGRVRKTRNITIDIPAGIDENTRIRQAGQGNAGLRGGPPGDLYVFISVKPHNLFERHGHDLLCHIPVSMVDAALGGELEVPTIEGKRARMAIPAGTQSGKQFRLRGKGMSVVNSANRGDMFIEVAVETPVDLTSRQRDLLEEFRQQGGGGERHSPATMGFFAKVRELWKELKE